MMTDTYLYIYLIMEEILHSNHLVSAIKFLQTTEEETNALPHGIFIFT